MLVGLVYTGTRVHQGIVRYEHYQSTQLVAYQPLLVEEQRPLIRPVIPRNKPILKRSVTPESKPTTSALVVRPQVKVISERRQIEPEPAAPQIKLESKNLVIPNAPIAPVVAVGTFSHASPVTAPVTKLADTVQPGGFGNSNAVASGPRGTGNALATGSFGSGGGFGQGTGTRAAGSEVKSSSFGNGGIDVLNTGLRTKGSPQPANEASSPVEITFKPKPDYTDAGRKLRINGEVRLEVLFKSDGRVVVVKVLKGLGYGLDEQAVKAAQQIKFKPAQHEGQAVDSMAQIHIIFELIS